MYSIRPRLYALITLTSILPLEINANTLVESNTYFDGFQFWSLPVTDTRACATLCTRLPLCVSFNFNLYSRNCELNRDVVENHTSRRVSRGDSVYSRIKDWSTEIDSGSCTCELDELCIPTQIFSSISTSSACMHIPSISSTSTTNSAPMKTMTTTMTTTSQPPTTTTETTTPQTTSKPQTTSVRSTSTTTSAPPTTTTTALQPSTSTTKSTTQTTTSKPQTTTTTTTTTTTATTTTDIVCPVSEVQRCNSNNQKYKECIVNGNIISIVLQEQLSTGNCRETIEWGYTDILIWVNDGCKAKFDLCLSIDDEVKQWVSSVIDFSSEYHLSGWSANQVIGSSDVYPWYGDIEGAWSLDDFTKNFDHYLEVQFPETLFVTGIDIYETYYGGAVTTALARISGGTWQILWGPEEPQAIEHARIFSPKLQGEIITANEIRLEIGASASDLWAQIDAIRMRGYRHLK